MKRLIVAAIGLALVVGIVAGGAMGNPFGASAQPSAPNPGHEWTQVEGHGTDGSTYWLGTTVDQALELRVNGARALRLEPNPSSPNVIGGFSGNNATPGVAGASVGGGGGPISPNRVTDWGGTVSGGAANRAGDDAGSTEDAEFATVGGGTGNTASGARATVGGGTDNTASGSRTTVGGGEANTATATHATIGGGDRNAASGDLATVGGGQLNTAGIAATVAGGAGNTADATEATVGGGRNNAASNQWATVGGGSDNTASDTAASVGGGQTNSASGQWSTVAGGRDNIASGVYATVAGGNENTAAGDFSLAGGHGAKANNVGCFVWADSTIAEVECNDDNRFVARASGGVYLYTSGDLSTGAYLAAGSSTWQPIGALSMSTGPDNLRAENAALRQRLSDLEARVAALEGDTATGSAVSASLLGLPALWPLLGGALGVALVGLVAMRRPRAGA